MSPAQATNARRLARVQKLASEIAAALNHSRGGLSNTADEALKAQRIAGVLINMMEPLGQASRRRQDQIARARRALATVLPPEITQLPTPDDVHRDANGLDAETAARLLGLNVDLGIAPGYTGEFSALASDERADVAETGIAPLTLPLPAISADDVAAANAPTPTTGRGKGRKGELPVELVDVWNMLAQMVSEGTQEERVVSNVSRDLGMLSRSVRQADAGIVWVLQALDAIRRDADQLQQISGAQPLGEAPGDSGALAGLARSAPSSVPLMSPGAAPRFPSPTRPRGEPGAAGAPDSYADAAGAYDATEGAPGAVPTPQDTPGSFRMGDLLGLDVLPPDEEHHEPPTDAETRD
jgi:hypothetical protein